MRQSSRRKGVDKMLLAKEEIQSKLKEIDEAIAKLQSQRVLVDELATFKADSLLAKWTNTCLPSMDVGTFKRENQDFVTALREGLKIQYEQYFLNTIAVLELSKSWLTNLEQA